MVDSALIILLDRFGDRWVRFDDSPSERFNNFDQDDDSLRLADLWEHNGPLRDYRTGSVIEIPGVN